MRVRVQGVNGGASVAARDWMWTGVWGWTASQPSPTGTAPTAGACARDVRGERRGGSCAPHAGAVTERGNGEGLSSGSQLTCTFYFVFILYYYILVVGRISFRFLKLEGSPMILMQIFSLFFPLLF